MSNYRVSTIKDKEHESMMYKDFDSLKGAEDYAQSASLYDDNHFYVVEKKIDEDEYQATKFFKRGQITVSF